LRDGGGATSFRIGIRWEDLIPRDLIPVIKEALGDRYTIEREIARGGAGRVFFARDAQDRSVALKILHPELMVSVQADRFLREIKLLARLDHPLIAKLLDFGERDWLVYFAMSYVEGATLRTILDQVRRTSIADVLRLGDDLLDALAYAHSQGIVHRDVKPANIILADAGAMLVDFGIARAVQVAGRERITHSGFTVGTSAYMSPEQAAGLPTIDHRSDLYSLGCVLFECLAGRPPFVHRHEAVVLELQQSQASPDVRRFRPDVPEALTTVLLKAMAKRPEQRWESAEDMRAAMAKSTQAVREA
jgi:serine/threonine protein kinase